MQFQHIVKMFKYVTGNIVIGNPLVQFFSLVILPKLVFKNLKKGVSEFGQRFSVFDIYSYS